MAAMLFVVVALIIAPPDVVQGTGSYVHIYMFVFVKCMPFC